ncbi:ribosomal maturation YjgA family protein [Paenibacillus lactis]
MPFIRGLVGDVIIVVFIYYFIMTLKDFNSIYVVIFTLVLAFITEVLQYFHFASILGLQHNKIAQLIIGSIFDPMDMIAYTIGGIVAFIIDTKIIKKPKNTHIRTY